MAGSLISIVPKQLRHLASQMFEWLSTHGRLGRRRVRELPFKQALIALLSLVGCTACDTICATHPDVTLAPDQSYLFAFSSVAFDVNADDVPHFGFNIDGRLSDWRDLGGCSEPDYLSSLDPDINCSAINSFQCAAPFSCRAEGCTSLSSSCHGGVDNQLAAFLAHFEIFGTNRRIDRTMSHDVETSRIAFLLQVSNIGSFEHDADVVVRIVRAFASFGGSCTAVPIGAPYQIDVTSVLPGAVGIEGALLQAHGEIIDGRLRVSWPDDVEWVTVWPFDEGQRPSAVWRIHHLTLRANISSAGLVVGNIGGWIPLSDLYSWSLEIDARAPLTSDGSQIRALLPTLGDISIEGTCPSGGQDSPPVGRMSLGLGFEAVLARLVDRQDAVAIVPDPGSCSSGTPADF